MLSNRLAFAAISLACIAAAAGGGYLATRQSQASSAIAAPALMSPSQPVTVAAAPPGARSRPAVDTPTRTGRGEPLSKIELREADWQRHATHRVAAGGVIKTPAATTVTAQNLVPQTASPGPATALVPTAPMPEASPTFTPAPLPDLSATPTRQDDIQLPDLPRLSEPPLEKSFNEVVVTADSVIGLQIEATINSERARIEDRVEARVTRDVRVGGQVAIPVGARALGTVTFVERGSKFKTAAKSVSASIPSCSPTGRGCSLPRTRFIATAMRRATAAPRRSEVVRSSVPSSAAFLAAPKARRSARQPGREAEPPPRRPPIAVLPRFRPACR